MKSTAKKDIAYLMRLLPRSCLSDVAGTLGGGGVGGSGGGGRSVVRGAEGASFGGAWGGAGVDCGNALRTAEDADNFAADPAVGVAGCANGMESLGVGAASDTADVMDGIGATVGVSGGTEGIGGGSDAAEDVGGGTGSLRAVEDTLNWCARGRELAFLLVASGKRSMRDNREVDDDFSGDRT